MLIKRLFLTLLLCLFPLSAFADEPGSWDKMDEDCDNYTDVGWADSDGASGVSDIDPAGQFRFRVTTGGAGEYAYRYVDIGSYPTTFTFEIKTYFDTLGTTGNVDNCEWANVNATLKFWVYFGTDGLFIYDGAAWNEVGTDIVAQDTWQTWRFVVDGTTAASATCDVYIDQVVQATGFDCSYDVVGTDGATILILRGYTISTESHFDWIKIATGLYGYPVAAAQVIFTSEE